MGFFRKTTEEEHPKPAQELVELRAAVQKAQLPEAVAAIAAKELERLDKTDASVAEYTIGINYLDYLISLPWNRFTEDNLDLKRAERILESQHYGLQHVKERILEYLAVRTLCSVQTSQILVVDDEEIARTNLEYILRKEGHQVATAANGLEALEKVKAQEFDVILTDLKMEKMDGIQLLESVKQIAPHTEIVMVTGYATVSSAVDALKKGAAHYLSKPIKLDELRATVREIIEKKRHMQMNRGPVLCFAGPPGTGKTSIGQAIAEALERKFVRLSLAGSGTRRSCGATAAPTWGPCPGASSTNSSAWRSRTPCSCWMKSTRSARIFGATRPRCSWKSWIPSKTPTSSTTTWTCPLTCPASCSSPPPTWWRACPRPSWTAWRSSIFPATPSRKKSRSPSTFWSPANSGNTPWVTWASNLPMPPWPRSSAATPGRRASATWNGKLPWSAASWPASASRARGPAPSAVDEELVEKFLGPRKFSHEVAEAGNQVGVTTGLVWTEFGGEIIFVEASRMRGHKQLILTGSLGDVLKESAQTALSYIRSHAESFGLDPDFFTESDIHIHLPSGAIPKEGPSAGVTIALALLSLLTGRPARRDVALTGELTLSGRILPVSGIREKVLAAQRAGVKVVVFPKANEVDIVNLEDQVKAGLEIVLADAIEPLVDLVLLPK